MRSYVNFVFAGVNKAALGNDVTIGGCTLAKRPFTDISLEVILDVKPPY